MTEIFDDQLILSYFKDFHSKEKANSIFEELCTYPFQPVKLNIYGHQYIPARLCCAFGDEDGLTYSFSGTSIVAQAWTPMLHQIKSEVEALTHEKYNYVLLNKYPDGDAKISAHRDDESSLDPSYCIPTLSYGATRVMHFTRENYMTHILSLEHGSLLVMKPPTNVVWKHGIPSQPEVKTIRISLTFRKIISPQVKRSSDEMDFGYYDDIIPIPCMNKRTFPRCSRYPRTTG
ncbi:DNA oxidative demethylase ALKBH2-like [Stegodyphus dumicola]|uniref:DNA oxidative demethylase ALKBH2-like n=1 Tax=Stegodyphus dumicola TaxID=202533 RepID=UPI0015A8DED7|nr:DNA oxidative demethylase ALKBH2-like [Stegodyphus dumicola]